MTITQIYWMAAGLGFIGGIAAAAIYYGYVLRKRDQHIADLSVALVDLDQQSRSLAVRNAHLVQQNIRLHYPGLSIEVVPDSLDAHIDSALAMIMADTVKAEETGQPQSGTLTVVPIMSDEEISRGLSPEEMGVYHDSQYDCARCAADQHPGKNPNGFCTCCSAPLP